MAKIRKTRKNYSEARLLEIKKLLNTEPHLSADILEPATAVNCKT
jgi:hypothetical protein